MKLSVFQAIWGISSMGKKAIGLSDYFLKSHYWELSSLWVWAWSDNIFRKKGLFIFRDFRVFRPFLNEKWAYKAG